MTFFKTPVYSNSSSVDDLNLSTIVSAKGVKKLIRQYIVEHECTLNYAVEWECAPAVVDNVISSVQVAGWLESMMDQRLFIIVVFFLSFSWMHRFIAPYPF